MHLIDQWLDEFGHNYEHLQYVAYRNYCEARLKTPLCKDEFLKKVRQRYSSNLNNSDLTKNRSRTRYLK